MIKAYILSVIAVCLVRCCNSRPNVLFVTIDDLRPELGCYRGEHYPVPVSPEMRTPHMDGLADQSLLLMRAHSQLTMCNPSRTSLMTGRRPDSTKVWENKGYFREMSGNFTTLPQYFKQNGYISQGMGKIYHQQDDPPSWSQPYYNAPNNGHWSEKDVSWQAVSAEDREETPLPDDQLVSHAIDSLRQYAPAALAGEMNFFMAVGFYKPHLPFTFPDTYLDYYPEENITLPYNPFAPWYMPDNAWFNYAELRGYDDINSLGVTGEINTTLPDFKALELRRAYYSTITYVDDLLGLLLSELKQLDLESSTIVVVLADHGWNLGEHSEWCKETNFELSTHVPVIIKIPGVTDHGIQSEALTELIDIYPTLVEAAGLPYPDICSHDASDMIVCREGQSLMPLINDPDGGDQWKPFAFSQIKRDDYMGYSIRSDRYRYNEFPRFNEDTVTMDWNDLDGVELYDHTIDPDENINRAHDEEYLDVIEELQEKLHDGWRAVIQ